MGPQAQDAYEQAQKTIESKPFSARVWMQAAQKHEADARSKAKEIRALFARAEKIE